jgi:hypothetical protein
MRWYRVDPFWGARDGTGGGVRSCLGVMRGTGENGVYPFSVLER